MSSFRMIKNKMRLIYTSRLTFPKAFARIFTKEDSIRILSASCIQKYTLGLLGVAIQYAIVDGLTAMGQIRLALPISFFRKILYVVCVFLIPMFGPLENVFYAETISDMVGACVTVMVFITIIVPKLRFKMKSKVS